MSRSLGQLEASFTQAANSAEQRQIVEAMHYAHARTQALYRGALKGVWIGIALTVAAVVLAVLFATDYAVWLIVFPAVLFIVCVFAAVGLALAKRIHGHRYSSTITVHENMIPATQQDD